MSRTRLVDAESPGDVQTLAQLMGAVPRPTIIIGFVRTYEDLRTRLAEEGVDLTDVFFIDATPHPSLEAFRPDAFFIGAPTLLERVCIVSSKVLPRLGGKAHIVVHDLAGVQNYNGNDMTRQFIHHMLAQAGRDGCDLDILVNDPSPQLASMVDEVIDLQEVLA